MSNPLSMNEAFIRRITDIVLANLEDENFGANELAKEAGVSRVTLYRKLKSIRNKNTSQFIREIRLQCAMKMLLREEGTVAEISYWVGFGSPSYFIKCFHEYYGIPPGEVKKTETLHALDHLECEQVINSDLLTGLKPAFGVKEGPKRSRHRKLLISVIGILSGMLIMTFLYFLLIQDRGITVRKKRPKRSIVVLPFKNLSDDQEYQYFADGVMEDILNYLFRVSDMRVISRTSSEHFREGVMTSPEIAKELKVNYVLEGSIQKAGKEVRIFVQLIDARDDQHIFSEKYEGEMANIFAFQSDIARKVATSLNAALSEEEIKQIEKKPTTNPVAYDSYLRARFLFHKSTSEQRFDISREGLMASIKYYEKAIAEDPGFTKAYAGLADVWYNLSAWGWYQPYPEGIQKALEYSNKALDLDPACAEAHAVKGVYLFYPNRKFEEARGELQTALRLDPNFATAHQWYAQLLMITGPITEARVHIDRALELEPYFWLMYNLSSWIYYFEEKYREGLDACFTGFDLNHYSLDNDWLFVLHYVKLDEGEKAARVLQNTFSRFPATSSFAGEIMAAYDTSGTEGIFEWLIDLNIHRPIPLEGLNGHPFYISWWYAILGNEEKSIYWLEKAVESERIPWHYFDLIANNPDYDILRDDPRFLAIIRNVGLAPYNTREVRQY